MAYDKILLLENERIDKLDIRCNMESFGYEVHYVSSNCDEVIEKALEILPDLILMNIVHKGDIEGIKVVSLIKDLNIPIIYLTDDSQEPTVEIAPVIESDAYIIDTKDSKEIKYIIDLAIYKNKTEKKLKESESKYKNIFENVQDIFYQTDNSGIITEISPSIERYSGYKPYELIGNPVEMAYFNPGDRNELLNEINAKGEVVDYELRLQTKNNRLIYVSTNTHYLYDLKGNIIGLEGSLRDITERKRVEDALRESNAKYRTLFESNPVYTILLDLEGNILDINDLAANLSGQSKNELIGKNFMELEFFQEEDLPNHKNRLQNFMYDQKVPPYVSKITINNQIRWLDNRIAGIKKDNKLNAILVISTDITKNKNTEKEIKSSLKEKEVLLKEIHHRVKNNMQIISSLLNLQTKYVADDKLAVDVLKESQNRVKSMAMIHEKLYQSNDISHIKFDDYIESIVSDLFYSYNIDKTQIKPFLSVEDVKLNIETAVPCGLIINELVSNILKHAFNGVSTGKIKISLKGNDDKYFLNISDNGIGFPEDIDFKNTNSLGMQLVNNLVDQIDGDITLNMSQGTEFKITFKELEYKERI